jgi:hypothetical protein
MNYRWILSILLHALSLTIASQNCFAKLQPELVLIDDLGTDEFGDQYENIFLQLDDEKVMIGKRRTLFPSNTKMGVDSETIVLKQINDHLILLEWTDYSEGMGAYTTQHFMILTSIKPHAVLLRQSVMISGHWSGTESVIEGSYSINLSNEPAVTISLKTRERELKCDNKNVEDPFACHYITTFVRQFDYREQKFVLSDVFTDYEVREEDTFESIAAIFNVSVEYFNDHKNLPEPGQNLRVHNQAPWPVVEKLED